MWAQDVFNDLIGFPFNILVSFPCLLLFCFVLLSKISVLRSNLVCLLSIVFRCCFALMSCFLAGKIIMISDAFRNTAMDIYMR
ncbi:hypothetical protein BJX76DRAFT_246989 [Aspergillus varians]